MPSIELKVEEKPFDLCLTLQGGQAFRWQCTDGWQTSVLFDNVVKLRQTESGVIEMRSSPSPPKELADKVSNYLALDECISEVHKELRRNPIVGSLVERYKGLRILRQDPWECLVSFILSTNSDLTSVSRNAEAIAQQFGTEVQTQGDDFVWVNFPTPSHLLKHGMDYLQRQLDELRLGHRAKYIAEATQTLHNEDLDLCSLRDVSYDDALKNLMSLSGVADKVANCVLLFSLGHGNAFPVDRWVARALESHCPASVTGYRTAKAKFPRMRKYAQTCLFKEYAGYVNQYLFLNQQTPTRQTT